MKPGTKWGFVIDTDYYSGGFVRELCGYLTGQDDGTHGGKEAVIARGEIGDAMLGWFENNVLFFPEAEENNGFPRCAHLYPTAGWFNHGMGGHFQDGQEEKALKDHRKVVEKYRKQNPGSLDGLDANVTLYRTPPAARRAYDLACSFLDRQGRNEYRGEGFDRVCIGEVQEVDSFDTYIGPRGTGTYGSHVIFLKGRVVVEVDEYSDDSAAGKDALIRAIAVRLSRFAE